MILQRLATSLRKQDWVTVVIETLIVVFGVYLGVQLGNWNTARNERALYEQSYDRMIAEVKGNIATLDKMRDDVREPIKIVQLAIDDLRECRTGPDAEARVQAAFVPMGITYNVSLSTAAIDQLISNESLLRFQSPELRSRLVELAASTRERSEASQMVSDRSSDWESASEVTAPGPLAYTGPDEVVEVVKSGVFASPELLRSQTLQVPLSEACKNTDFMRGFYTWEDNAYFQFLNATLTADRLRAQLVALGHPMDEDEADAVETDAEEAAP